MNEQRGSHSSLLRCRNHIYPVINQFPYLESSFMSCRSPLCKMEKGFFASRYSSFHFALMFQFSAHFSFKYQEEIILFFKDSTMVCYSKVLRSQKEICSCLPQQKMFILFQTANSDLHLQFLFTVFSPPCTHSSNVQPHDIYVFMPRKALNFHLRTLNCTQG